MPRVKAGLKGVYVDLPQDLLERFQTLADANGRAFKDELAHAMERHLSAPPTLVIQVPALLSASIGPPSSEPRRGRPRKGKAKETPSVSELPQDASGQGGRAKGTPARQPRKRKGG